MNDTQESLDLILDVIIDDEPACDYNHEHPSAPPCGGFVSYRTRGCIQDGNVCTPAASDIERRMAAGIRCAGCGMRGSECWRVFPI